MLNRVQRKNGFEEFSKKLFWGKFWGGNFWILAELKNPFFHRIENHIIKNIQIGHFSLKPLIIPFGECGGTGGSKVENSPNWKILFLNDRETYYINIKMWLCFLKSLITPFGERGGRGGSKVENSPNWKILFLNDRETHYINIKIGHFSVKPLITPFWGVWVEGGQKLKIHQIEKKKNLIIGKYLRLGDNAPRGANCKMVFWNFRKNYFGGNFLDYTALIFIIII